MWTRTWWLSKPFAFSGLKSVGSAESLQKGHKFYKSRLSFPWDLGCLDITLLFIHHCQEDIIMMKLLARVVFPSASYRLEAWDLSVADLFMNHSDNYRQNISIKLELLLKVFQLSIFTSRYLARAESQTHNWHSKAVTLHRFLNVLKIYCLVTCKPNN